MFKRAFLFLLVGAFLPAQSIDYSRIRNGPGISVTSKGALGNGVTNDAAAIQSAINAAVSTHGEVFCPPGTYNLGSTALTASGGFTISAPKGGCVFTYSGASSALTVGTSSTTTYDFQFSGIQINLTNNAGSCLYLLRTHNARVDGLHCEGQTVNSSSATNIGITIDGGTSDSIATTILNPNLNHVYTGIYVTGPTTTVSVFNGFVFGDDRAGSTGVLFGNASTFVGDGFVWVSGNFEHEDYGVYSNNGAGYAMRNASFIAPRCEHINVTGIYLEQFAFNNQIIASNNCTVGGAGAGFNANMNIAPNVGSGFNTPSSFSTTLNLSPGEGAAANVPQKMINATIPSASTQPLVDVTLDSGGVKPFQLDYRGLITYMNQNATVWGVNNANPNGNLTAPVGSLTCWPGGPVAGRICYVKESGSGNTGWNGLVTSNPSTNVVNFPDPTSGRVAFLGTDTGSGTNFWWFQPGFGSASAGGSLLLYQQANSTHPGYVVAGLGNTVGKFTVNSQADGAGSDLFLVDTAGNISAPRLPTSAGTGGLYLCVDSTGAIYKKSSCP